MTKRQAHHIGDLHLTDSKVAGHRSYHHWAKHDLEVAATGRQPVPDDDTVIYVYEIICEGNLPFWEYSLDAIGDLPKEKVLFEGSHDPERSLHNTGWTKQRGALKVFTAPMQHSSIRLDGCTVMKSHFSYDGDHLAVTEARYTQWRLPDEDWPLIHAHVHDAWTMQPSLDGSVQVSVSWEKWRNSFAADRTLLELNRFEEHKAIVAALALKTEVEDWGGGS